MSRMRYAVAAWVVRAVPGAAMTDVVQAGELSPDAVSRLWSQVELEACLTEVRKAWLRADRAGQEKLRGELLALVAR
jgi:hypothetical protein